MKKRISTADLSSDSCSSSNEDDSVLDELSEASDDAFGDENVYEESLDSIERMNSNKLVENNEQNSQNDMDSLTEPDSNDFWIFGDKKRTGAWKQKQRYWDKYKF